MQSNDWGCFGLSEHHFRREFRLMNSRQPGTPKSCSLFAIVVIYIYVCIYTVTIFIMVFIVPLWLYQYIVPAKWFMQIIVVEV